MSKQCQNIGCGNNAPDGQKLCIFHQPMDKKSVDKQHFMGTIEAKLSGNDYNFNGYKIPYSINLSDFTIDDIINCADAEFKGHVNLSKTTFNRHAVFNKAKFYNGIDLSNSIFNDGATFDKAEFYENVKGVIPQLQACIYARHATFNKGLNFFGAKFLGNNADFWGANYEGSAVFFSGCEFSGGKAIFSESTFKDCDVFFEDSEFLKDGANFGHCKFPDNPISFNGAKFIDGMCDFSNAVFNGDLKIQNCEIKGGLSFVDTRFGEKSSFYFTEPKFIAKEKADDVPYILFKRVQFKPFQTYFEGFKRGQDYKTAESHNIPIIAFRNCYLKDVYFNDNDMTFFSFYKSAFFEESHFTASHWPKSNKRIWGVIPALRRIQVCEEIIYEYLHKQKSIPLNNNLSNLHEKIKFPQSYSEIAELYLRLKNSTDKAKDYQLAGYFYFNEFEMKRQRFLEKAKNLWAHPEKEMIDNIKEKSINSKITTLSNRLHAFDLMFRYVAYSCYRIFAGYGEMSMWSFGWFSLMVFMFSGIHMFNGLKLVNEKTGDLKYAFKYCFTFDLSNVGKFSDDFLIALKYTIYRILPQTYLPFGREGIVPLHNGFWDIVLSILTTIVLLFMIVFIGIGLKRHFRRF